MKSKYLVVVIMIIIVSSCNSQKSTINDKHQEYENEKRQEAFDELYNDNH